MCVKGVERRGWEEGREKYRWLSLHVCLYVQGRNCMHLREEGTEKMGVDVFV